MVNNGFDNEYLNIAAAHIIVPLIILFIRLLIWLTGVKHDT